jgi:hypothetical protein
MNRQAAEEQVYRTTTVGQLVAALVECHDALASFKFCGI